MSSKSVVLILPSDPTSYIQHDHFRMVDEYVKHDPSDLELSELHIWHCIVNGKYQDAVELLTEVIALNYSMAFYLYRAWVLRYLNRLKSAEEDLTTYLEVAQDPCPWEVYFERGECRVRLGDHSGAENDAYAIEALLTRINDATMRQEAVESIKYLHTQINRMPF